MIDAWELAQVENWSTDQIKNRIWSAVSLGQPIPGCGISVETLRAELIRRGETPEGYHNT